MKYQHKLILLLIFVFSLGIRLVSLDSNPKGLTWDEAALGYNAYSLLKTSKDEYGEFLPLHLKSFGDYKPAVVAYIMIPSVAIFGLNEWGVRIPAALFGSLSVVLVYLVIQELFKGKSMSRSLALLAAFMMAISPFSIQFSRPAFESSFALVFNLLGLLLFLKAENRKQFFVYSALSFGASLFTYQSSRLFVPLLTVGMFLWQKKVIMRNKFALLGLVIFSSFLSLIFYTVAIKGESSRLAALNLFSYNRTQAQIELITKEDALPVGSKLLTVLHGEWFSYAKGFVERYLIYFSPKMLFIDGDYSQRHKVPDLGILYFVDILLIPLGVALLLRRGMWQRSTMIIFLWLLLAPIPAALSRDLISINRAFNLVFPFTVFSGAGAYYLYKMVSHYKRISCWGALAIFFVVLVINLIVYFDRYFIHAPYEYSSSWLYGNQEAMRSISTLISQKRYENIILTDGFGQPYIFYLFYNRYDPASYQKQANLQQLGVDVGTVNKLDSIVFRSIYWPKDRGLKNSLFLGTAGELPDQDTKPFKEFHIIKDINYPNGERAYRILETD